jgi:dimethylamine/trimethylamine dehydrogenase
MALVGDKYDVLFEPVQIGPKTLKNRFYQVPQCNGAGTDKPGFQAYHRAVKAEGGWAALCTEYCSVSPESDGTDHVAARLWDDGDVQNLAAMCDHVHAFDALAGVELWYGSRATNLETRNVGRGPSVFPSQDPVGIYPRYMDEDDIRLVQGYYVDAAIRARDAGFDIVYVYQAHSQLPSFFLSKRTNKRTDRYGGSFENRLRFWRELLEMVREAVGDDCAIASRASVDSLQGPDGIELHEDGLRAIEALDHLVDLWDVTIGSGEEWGQDAGASRFFEQNHEKPYTAAVKAGNHTNKPVVGVGRFTDPDVMVEVVTSGQYDIIGAARPSIADPFLPAKIAERRFEDIRECIGCNHCVGRWEMGGPPIVCTQNATAGEEYRRGWHPERFRKASNSDKGVLVIGAGPSGMECATILGKRGMEAVHLVEAERELGGHLRWVTKLGHSDGQLMGERGMGRGLGEWGRVTNYRKIQLDKLKNVAVHTKARLSASDVLDYGAEIVIVATGCSPVTDGLNPVSNEPIPGADTSLDWQLTARDVALGAKPVGERVLILENERYHLGASVAQQLAGAGHRVTLMTHVDEFASLMRFTLEGTMMRRELHRLGIDLRPHTMISAIEPGRAHAYNVWDPIRTETLEFDSIVLCTMRQADDALYRELKAQPEALAEAGIEQLHVIGDAHSPRLMPEAIFDGHRLAREIDSPDPRFPLPFIRERRLWGATGNDDYEAQLQVPRDFGLPVTR